VTSSATERPSADPVVRELRWSDFDGLREAYYLLYEERLVHPEIGITLFGTQPSHADEVAWFSDLYRRVESGAAVVVVAEQDGRVIGNCTVGRVGPTDDFEGGHVGVLGILVHRDHRSRGVGSALLARALEQCRGRFELVRLTVFSVNVRAHRLYERFGFVDVGTLPAAVRRGDRYFDEQLMVLDLREPNANR
jgi:RimJ/RimL family protein N-acetyltransferase